MHHIQGRPPELMMPSKSKRYIHANQIRNVKPSAQGCGECLKTGDDWVELRICMICCHVGCCNSSKNKHATKHFLATGHPIIKDFPDKQWTWCYVDEMHLREGVHT